MPEIKNSFTQGRMNKDLDERVLPKGEYRDALNVEVTTSQGSNVGSVQSLSGNIEVSHMVGDDATCFGYVVDESKDCVYYFVHNALNQPFDHGRVNGITTDAIIRYTAPTHPNSFGFSDVILSDVHKVLAAPPKFISTFSTSHPNNLPATADPFSQIAVVDGTGICVGMEIMARDASGNPLWPSGPTTVLSIEEPTAVGLGSLSQRLILMSSYRPHITSAQQAIGAYYEFNHEKALNLVVGRPMTYTDDDGVTGIFTVQEIENRIHSANVIDDLLFFTDNNDEPKKINIERCKAGTEETLPLYTRTLLKVEDEAGGFTDPSLNDGNLQINTVGVSGGSGGTFSQYTATETPIRKEHITVIRKNPDKQLRVELKTERRDGSTSGTISSLNSSGLAGGSLLEISFTGILDYRIGDVVKLVSTTGNTTIIGTIINVDNTTTANTTVFEISINSIENPTTALNFNITLEDDDDLYDLTFPKFSYRYKYEDGEYSSYAPFSKPAFLPGIFSLDSQEGHNTGMQNTIKRILLKDFVPADIPEDVKEVEILYKDSVSPNIYTIDSFNRFSDEFRKTPFERILTGSTNVVSEYTGLTYKNHRGRLEVSKEVVGAALPSNQLLRPWDNVPRKALTQEISANRIIYANYLQNYDLTDGINTVDIDVDINIKQYKRENGSTIGHPSVKSGRTYQIGVVYRDKYGRETPVLTNEKCVIKADNSLNRTINQISVVLRNKPPFWADSYKFYIKEAATEYYNLAADRVYPCEHEPNMFWVAFNSADRNKLDEESLLRLTKVFDGGAYDSLRNDYNSEPYKIISIVSEVPEPLKKEYENYQSVDHLRLAAGTSISQNDHVNYSNFGTAAGSTYWTNGDFENCRILISTNVSDRYGSNPNPWQPVPPLHPQGGRPGGAWELLKCQEMYNDYLANRPELQVRVTAVGNPNTGTPLVLSGAPVGFSSNQTDWMTINGIADKTNYLDATVDSSQDEIDGGLARPHYSISAKNFTWPNITQGGSQVFARWQTGGNNNVSSGTGYRYEFRKVTRSVKEYHEGKFFVKMKRKPQIGTGQANVLGGPGAGELDNFGNIVKYGQRSGKGATRDVAVFEVLPKREQEIDLYFEASRAFPIVTKNAKSINLIRSRGEGLVNVGDIVTAYEITSAGVMQELTTSASYVSALDLETHPFDSTGTQTVVSYVDDYNDDGVISISLTNGLGGAVANQNITSSTTSDIYFKFTNPEDFSSVTLKLAMPTFNAATSITNPQGNGFVAGTFTSTQGLSNVINCLPFGHSGQSNHLGQVDEVRIGLPYFNCFSQRGLGGLEIGVESNRIRDDFNAPTIDKGVRASTVFDDYKEERRGSGLIYSGIYNSTSGVNDTNQFIQAEKITKDLNPTYGSIQKIHTMENNLLALCEDKCLNILTNKDALYNADGNSQLVSTNRVLGDASPYGGDFGISKNPESFANYGFKSFFTDANRGVVLRLSNNGLTPISEIGMKDWFKDNLGTKTIIALGSFDQQKQNYNLTITNSVRDGVRTQSLVEGSTVSYSVGAQGWTSFKSWIKENGFSISNKYYTTFKGEVFKHHVETVSQSTGYSGTAVNPGTAGNTLTLTVNVDFLAPGFIVEGDGIPVGTTIVSVDSNTQITVSNTVTTPAGTTITFRYPTNNFYSGSLNFPQHNSTLTFIFNEGPDAIKSFKTINYEGSQAKILENTSDIYYYNNVARDGWYVDSITTDQQEGKVKEFKNKEGKWFNQIQGEKTEWENASGVQSARGNVDPREFAVQGIGLSKAITVENEDSEPIGPESGVKSYVEVLQEFTAPVGWCTSRAGTNATQGWCTINAVHDRMILTHGESIGTTSQPLRNFEMPASTTSITAPFASLGTVGGYPSGSGSLPIVSISTPGSANNSTTNPGNFSTMQISPQYHGGSGAGNTVLGPLFDTGHIVYDPVLGQHIGTLSITAKDIFIPNYPGPVGQWDDTHPSVNANFSGSGLSDINPHNAYAATWPGVSPQNVSATSFDIRTDLAPATPPFNNTPPWTINSQNNVPSASSGLTWPSTMNPVVHTVVQAATAANGWIGKHRWSGGWFPEEIAYVEFEDTLYRTDERDASNTVLCNIYWQGVGNSLCSNGLVNAFIPGPGGSKVIWGFHFDADGPIGGCWKASHTIPIPMALSAVNNSVANSTVTITPNYFLAKNTLSNSTNGNAQVTSLSGNQPKELDTLFTATFLADSGYYIKDFPDVKIESENPENYIIEKVEEIDVVNGKIGSSYQARITADQNLVNSGEKKYSVVKQTEEERREKLLSLKSIVTFEDDVLEIESPYTSDVFTTVTSDRSGISGNYIRKRIIKVKHNGKTSTAGDTITFNHNITTNPS